jgi:hypothetical protein
MPVLGSGCSARAGTGLKHPFANQALSFYPQRFCCGLLGRGFSRLLGAGGLIACGICLKDAIEDSAVLNDLLLHRRPSVGTVDSFQCQERDVIAIALTRSNA